MEVGEPPQDGGRDRVSQGVDKKDIDCKSHGSHAGRGYVHDHRVQRTCVQEQEKLGEKYRYGAPGKRMGEEGICHYRRTDDESPARDREVSPAVLFLKIIAEPASGERSCDPREDRYYAEQGVRGTET